MPTWTFELRGDPAAKLQQAQAAAAARGVNMQGDSNSGTFSGRGLAGTYRRSGSSVTVTMTSKPIIASWDYVQAQLREFLEG